MEKNRESLFEGPIDECIYCMKKARGCRNRKEFTKEADWLNKATHALERAKDDHARRSAS